MQQVWDLYLRSKGKKKQQTNKKQTPAKFGFEAFMEASVISPSRNNILEVAIGNSEAATYILCLSLKRNYIQGELLDG